MTIYFIIKIFCVLLNLKRSAINMCIIKTTTIASTATRGREGAQRKEKELRLKVTGKCKCKCRRKWESTTHYVLNLHNSNLLHFFSVFMVSLMHYNIILHSIMED